MLFMNEYEIDEHVRRFRQAETPHLLAGAEALNRLREWTNANSDGWAYWKLPINAAKKLITLLRAADRFDPTDCTEKELRAAFTPIKTFLTKRGVDHAVVFPPPEPEPDPNALLVEVVVGGKWVKLDPDDGLVAFRVNGRDVCAVDIFYADPNNQLEDGDGPYLTAGHWATFGPDGGEDWVRDATYPICEGEA